MKMTVADYIAEFLACQGIDYVFEMAGGMITRLLDSIQQIEKTTIVSVHHEQTAAFAADAYGRCTGKTGVALATSGPGATNLLTGIGSCYFDSSPAIFITGQVNLHEQKGERNIRQLGFQEADIVSMAEAVTKKSFRVTAATQVESILQEAYSIAISGRPGPVLIDLPMNLQNVEIEVNPIQKIHKKSLPVHIEPTVFTHLLTACKEAKRPLILLGRGLSAGQATENFMHLAEKLQIPIVTSLLGLDILPYAHPLRVGFIGSYGNRWANIALGTADLLIVIGCRLDIRQTGADVKSFRNNKKIFHVDCDENEINNRVKNCIPMVMDAADFTDKMLTLVATQSFNYSSWMQEIKTLKTKWPDSNELQNIIGINPNRFMHALSQQSSLAAGYVVDVGNHQMWAAQSLEITNRQFFMTSGGMGAMGFALPAAIGATLAKNKQPVVVIAGDGSFQVNIQDLQTVVRNKLPLKIIVMNNNSLGMIRQFQDSYFAGRYQSTYWGYSAPNFAAIAKAYEINATTISTLQEIDSALNWLWENENEAALLQVMVDYRVNAYPKIAFGKPITEMEPFAKPMSMEST